MKVTEKLIEPPRMRAPNAKRHVAARALVSTNRVAITDTYDRLALTV
jgi:hypothetical protein